MICMLQNEYEYDGVNCHCPAGRTDDAQDPRPVLIVAQEVMLLCITM